IEEKVILAVIPTTNFISMEKKQQWKQKFQSKQEVVINATIEKVWEYNMDLTKIPEYHPRVTKVDLISENKHRKAGTSYKCHLNKGKNTCIEKDIEIVPMEKI